MAKLLKKKAAEEEGGEAAEEEGGEAAEEEGGEAAEEEGGEAAEEEGGEAAEEEGGEAAEEEGGEAAGEEGGEEVVLPEACGEGEGIYCPEVLVSETAVVAQVAEGFAPDFTGGDVPAGDFEIVKSLHRCDDCRRLCNPDPT